MREAREGSSISSCAALLFGILVPGMALGSTLQFRSFETHSHLVVPVDPSVAYSVERIVKADKTVGLRLILENVESDPGLPAAAADLRTERIIARRDASASGLRIVYEVGLSEKARQSGIEFFGYRNKAPAEVIVDYWLKTQKEKQATQAQKPAAKAQPAKAVKTVAAPTNKPVDPADAGCGIPLDPATHGIAHWNVYHKVFDYQGFFKLESADQHYRYLQPEKDARTGAYSKEAAHYKLALKLYKEDQHALVLRTIEFFFAQYPQSAYANELEFLRANTLVKLSRLLRTERYADQAIDVLRRVVLAAPDSERGRAALAFIVQEYMTRGTPTLALEYALMGADREGEAGAMDRWVYRLASAEALIAASELDRAGRAYQLIMDQENEISPEAAFRIGELLSSKGFWERAAISYEAAIRQFSKDASRFPTAWFNLAEAYFRLGRYEESEKTYREFARLFPTDQANWAAGLRIAELEQMKIKAADVKKDPAVRALYEQIVNSHPYTPGAMMAELRLARCIKNRGEKDRTRNFFANFFRNRELKKFESPLVTASQVETWVDLAEAEFHLDNGDFRAALARADRYRANPLFLRIFSKAAVSLVQVSEKDVLAVVEHYGDFVQKPEPVGYLLKVLKARLDKGDLKATSSLMSTIEGRLVDASAREKDSYWTLRAQFSRLIGEKPDQVMLHLSRVSESGHLAAEKYELLAASALDKNDLRAGVAYLTHLLDGGLVKRLTPAKALELSAQRIEAVARQRDAGFVLKLADEALIRYGAVTELATTLSRLRDLRATALYDLSRQKEAAEAFDEILLAQPNHPRRHEFEFMRAKSLSRLGREGEAMEAFRKLAGVEVDSIWKKSAQAELEQIQWENNVKPLIRDDRRSE